MHGYLEHIIENTMIFNYIEGITTKENTETRDGVIAINTEIPGRPTLDVYNEEKDEWFSASSPNSLSRMSRLDDLFTSFYEREWFVGGRLFVKGDDLFMTTGKYESSIPVINESDPMFKLTSGDSFSEEKEEFETLYAKLMRVKFMEDTNEIDFGTDYYKYLVSTRDLIDKSTTVDIFSYSENSTDYGSTLNLNQYFTNPGNYSIKLGVMYVKSGVRVTESFLFEPFTRTDEEKYEYNNFLVPVNKDVTIEVKNGCIRVFPDKKEVTECIIHYCHLIYEKLL